MKILEKVLSMMTTSLLVSVIIVGAYLFGYRYGFSVAKTGADDDIKKPLEERVGSAGKEPSPAPKATTKPQATSTPRSSWGGPELWEAVNKRRQELGVNPLSQKSELCTIAAIRLSQILELGKLDGHEGFAGLPETRPDLKWIFDKYDISEFLLSGASSPAEAVSLWENTLGHKQLLSGGEYVWGCVYVSYGFSVAVAAY